MRRFTWGPEAPTDTPSSSGTRPLSGAPPHYSSSTNVSTCTHKNKEEEEENLKKTNSGFLQVFSHDFVFPGNKHISFSFSGKGE